MCSAIRMLDCGEQALVIEFGSRIDPLVNARVHRLARTVNAELAQRIVEVVPTYRSLTIYFDPCAISREALRQEIAIRLPALDRAEPSSSTNRILMVPVCYGGEFGPDLHFVAARHSLTADEVVAIHTSVQYRVYMLGFSPGFPYLGGLPERIAAPRLDVPRMKVAAGSVGIAGAQTGIYPMESPGGWRLIGRTPLKVFDPSAERPFLFAAGDLVRFVRLEPNEYDELREQVERGTFVPEIRNSQASS
jgi:inhibitor of KinA